MISVLWTAQHRLFATHTGWIETGAVNRASARAASAVLACVGLLVTSKAAFAQANAPVHESASLHYARQGAAESCPDSGAIEERVAAQLGYQPFQPDGRLRADVVMSGDAKGLRARITLVDPAGKTGHRELISPSRDCQELASAVSLALSIAIDPVSAGKQHDQPEEPIAPKPPLEAAAPAPAPVAPPKPAPPPPSQPEIGPPVNARVGAGILASFGTAPAPAFGVAVFIGAERGAFSVDLEARADLPASRTVEPRGTVESSLLLATLLPCVHLRPWFACAAVSGGALQGSGKDVAQPEKKTTFYSAAGARLGVELAFGQKVGVLLFGGGAATLTRTTLSLNGSEAWTTPILTGVVGSELVFHFE